MILFIDCYNLIRSTTTFNNHSSTRTLATKKMETQNVQHTRVAVIGAGITGLSVGLCLSQLYRGRVAITFMAERFSPHTTSDSSGGLVIPSFSSYGTRERGKQAGEVANDRLQQWAYVTYDHLRRLCEEEGLRPEDGLMLVPTYKYFEESYPVPEWASHVIDFRSLEATEGDRSGPEGGSLQDRLALQDVRHRREAIPPLDDEACRGDGRKNSKLER